MTAFIYSFIFIFAESGSGGGGFTQVWNTYFNYPGFEAWKFLNLAIFIGVLVYLLKKPLTDAFKAKRETIRAELVKAEEEKQAALAQLTAAEAALARRDTESATIRETAAREAAAEKQRVAEQAEAEISKLREQTRNEINRAATQAKLELRRFSAEESIRLAEEKIKREINPEKDAQLVKANIQSIGGLN